jgi:hypothetical protein
MEAGARFQQRLPWLRGSACVLLVLALAGLAAAAKEQKAKEQKLDLSTMRAHEQAPDTKLPDYVALEMLREHNASAAACVEKHGEHAQIDGSGGCVCSESHVLSESGACIHESNAKKGRRGGKGLLSMFKKKSEFDDIPGMEPCKGAGDCAEKLRAHYASVEGQVQACRARDVAIGGKIAGGGMVKSLPAPCPGRGTLRC